MTKPTYGFSPDTIAGLVGEEGIEELLTEYQGLANQYLAMPAPALGEVVNATFYRTVHSLKAASQFVGAERVAEEALALETACKDGAVCNGAITTMATDLQLQLKDINTQITHYLRSR
ncbi:Hpt domain-containing protein [Vibrio coralliilyticus]